MNSDHNYQKLSMLVNYHPDAPEGYVYLRNMTRQEANKIPNNLVGEDKKYRIAVKTFDRSLNVINDNDLYALFIRRKDIDKRYQVIGGIKPIEANWLDSANLIMAVIVGILAVIGGLTIFILILKLFSNSSII